LLQKHRGESLEMRFPMESWHDLSWWNGLHRWIWLKMFVCIKYWLQLRGVVEIAALWDRPLQGLFRQDIMLLKIYLVPILQSLEYPMNSGSWLILELSSYLFVLLSASHHLEKSLVNVIIRDRVINGILLKSFFHPLILGICVSEASNPALLLASLKGQSLVRNREWPLGWWVRRSLLCQLLTMLIMYPLIIVHNGSLNHLHLITGYWCVTSTMKFAIRFL
jgi:hypothetical protein